jgi:hypothetical protein
MIHQLIFFLCLPAIPGNHDACFAALCVSYAKIVFGCCGLSRLKLELKLQAGVSGAATLRFTTSWERHESSGAKVSACVLLLYATQHVRADHFDTLMRNPMVAAALDL